MTLDSYTAADKQAKCSVCGKFMPWSRSDLAERSDGMPLPSPVYVEQGVCETCETENKAVPDSGNGGRNED